MWNFFNIAKYRIKPSVISTYLSEVVINELAHSLIDFVTDFVPLFSYTHGGPVKGFVSLMYSLDGSTKTVRGDVRHQFMKLHKIS